MLPQDLPRGHVETGLLRAVARGNAVHATTYRLVEAEAGRRVGEDVGVDGVRDVRLPVGNGPFLGGEALHDAAQPREHGVFCISPC